MNSRQIVKELVQKLLIEGNYTIKSTSDGKFIIQDYDDEYTDAVDDKEFNSRGEAQAYIRKLQARDAKDPDSQGYGRRPD